MFCTQCGYEIPEMARFCPNCGKMLPQEKPWWDVPKVKHYKENRSPVTYVLLSILTAGIYSIYVKCQLGREVEEICRGDGEHTMSYIGAFFISMLSFGAFDITWTYLLNARIERYMQSRYQMNCRYKSNSILTFGVISYVTLGVTRFICDVFLLENVNYLAACNNQVANQPEGFEASEAGNHQTTGQPVGFGFSEAGNGNM